MHYFFLFLCLLWILSYGATTELVFKAMPLGSSGLLITWDPRVMRYRINLTVYNMTYSALEEQLISDEIEKIRVKGNITFDAHQSNGQYKIFNLIGNTQYRINITEIKLKNDLSQEPIKEYSIIAKTNLKPKPAKPDFKYELMRKNYTLIISDGYHGYYSYSNVAVIPAVKVMWLPCGKERECHGADAGTQFSVQYKRIDSAQVYSVEEVQQDRVELNISPATKYEVAVTSINGVYETQSDFKEVFLMPEFGPARNVRILQMTDYSALIYWDPPTEMLDVQVQYVLSHAAINNENKSEMIYDWDAVGNVTFLSTDQLPHKISFWGRSYNSYETMPYYIISILPVGVQGFGFEYRFNFTLTRNVRSHYEHRSRNSPSLELAEAEFEITKHNGLKTIGYTKATTWVVIRYFPCGRMFNCENRIPSYEFSGRYKVVKCDSYEDTKYINKNDEGYVEIAIQPNKTYEITLSSHWESYSSKETEPMMILADSERVMNRTTFMKMPKICPETATDGLYR